MDQFSSREVDITARKGNAGQTGWRQDCRVCRGDVVWAEGEAPSRGLEAWTALDGCPCSEVLYDSREIYFEPRDEDLGEQRECVQCRCHGVGRRNGVLGMEGQCM